MPEWSVEGEEQEKEAVVVSAYNPGTLGLSRHQGAVLARLRRQMLSSCGIP